MKGNQKVIDAANGLLRDELAADVQYGHHEAVARSLGYDGFAGYIAKRRADEREHASEFRARILLLGGVPVADVGDISVKNAVIPSLDVDEAAEVRAVVNTRAAAKIALDAGDVESHHLFTHIAGEEEEHLHDIETYKAMIRDMGAQNFLSLQVQGAD